MDTVSKRSGYAFKTQYVEHTFHIIKFIKQPHTATNTNFLVGCCRWPSNIYCLRVFFLLHGNVSIQVNINLFLLPVPLLLSRVPFLISIWQCCLKCIWIARVNPHQPKSGKGDWKKDGTLNKIKGEHEKITTKMSSCVFLLVVCINGINAFCRIVGIVYCIGFFSCSSERTIFLNQSCIIHLFFPAE